MGLVSELRRRNVFRVGVAYIVAAWLIIQVSETIFPLFGLGDTPARVVVILLAIGFPLFLVFSWAFEITPAGLKLEKDIRRVESVSRNTGKKLDRIIIVLLALAVSYLAIDKFVVDPSRDAALVEETARQIRSDVLVESLGEKSIAVLPFVPLSSGEDDSYFADGLTEEILSSLAQLPDLRVTGRSSSFFFKGQNVPVPEIAAQLNVAHIVEGSVRRDAKQVRITAQLVRASDGFQLWSQTYDRTSDDIIAIQEDIAENVAEALDVVLDDDARRIMRSAGIRDVEAFIAYNKGLDAFAAAHMNYPYASEPLAIANAFFDRALEAAPGLTAARLLKADLASHVIHEIAAGYRDEKFSGEAQEVLSALQAEYDLAWRTSPPGNQRAILDVERTLFREDWSGLRAKVQNAVQPGRCPQINRASEYLGPFGWAEQWVEKHREALVCDPMDNLAITHLPLLLTWAGDPDAALRAIDEAEDKGVSYPWLDDMRFWATLAAGDVNSPAVLGPGSDGSLMRRYPRQILRDALAGDVDGARQMAEEFWSGPDADDFSSLVVAAVVGDRERANELAARIDAFPGSAVVFSAAITYCFCGAPFDLEATPNFRTRIEEAGLRWPPPKRIDYPTKAW